MFEETAANGVREKGIVTDGYVAATDANGNYIKNEDGSYKVATDANGKPMTTMRTIIPARPHRMCFAATMSSCVKCR